MIFEGQIRIDISQLSPIKLSPIFVSSEARASKSTVAETPLPHAVLQYSYSRNNSRVLLCENETEIIIVIISLYFNSIYVRFIIFSVSSALAANQRLHIMNQICASTSSHESAHNHHS